MPGDMLRWIICRNASGLGTVVGDRSESHAHVAFSTSFGLNLIVQQQIDPEW